MSIEVNTESRKSTRVTTGAPLLTIAIPTYNRSSLLDLALSQLVPQVVSSQGRVELVVSDNCSTDGTQSIVEKYIATGAPILYICRESNIGSDRNFEECFRMASGKYFLIVGDDDVVLDGAVDRLVRFLDGNDFGVVHINSYPFKNDFIKEGPKKPRSGKAIIYSDKRRFANKVNIMLTFISGNVINKSIIGKDINIEPFAGTNLIHLSWTLAAFLGAEKNVFLDDHIIAAKTGNTGGYQLCTVFGTNMNKIFRIFEERGADPAIFRIVKRKTIEKFFPGCLLDVRRRRGVFLQEDHFGILRTEFKGHTGLWTMAWPAAKWPLPLAKVWLKICRNMLKFVGQW